MLLVLLVFEVSPRRLVVGYQYSKYRNRHSPYVIGADRPMAVCEGRRNSSLARWPPNPSHCWALTWRTIGPWRTIRPALEDYWLDGPFYLATGQKAFSCGGAWVARASETPGRPNP
jgi:hypothetical protein